MTSTASRRGGGTAARVVRWAMAGLLIACSAQDPSRGGAVDEPNGGAGGGSAMPVSGAGAPGTSGTGGGVAPSAAGGGGGASGGGAPVHACRIIYNGESGAGDVSLVGATTWTDPNGANGSSSVSESTVNPHSGKSSLKVDLKWNTGYYGGAFGFNWAGYAAPKAYDISSAQNLEFWARVESGTNDHFVLWLGDASGKASSRDKAGGYVPLVTTEWQHFTIPLAAYSEFDPTQVWELDGDTHSKPFGTAGGVTFYLDDIAFTGEACP